MLSKNAYALRITGITRISSGHAKHPIIQKLFRDSHHQKGQAFHNNWWHLLKNINDLK